MKDSQIAIELEENNIRAHFIMGISLCNIGKKTKSLKKI